MRKFKQQKEKAVNELKASIKVGDVDEALIPLLAKINSLEEYYTTSSCAGRISILQDLGGKGVNKFVEKWHGIVEPDEVLDKIKPMRGTLWFRFEPPIIHVVARTLEHADSFMTKAREAGFKRSGIQSFKDERIVMEILSTERIDAPLAAEGKALVSEEYLCYLTNTANKKFKESKRKIGKLMETI